MEAITRQLGERLRLSTPVRRVERHDDRVEITPEGAEPEHFDEVIFAAHSDQVLRMLADPNRAEAEVLGSIPYQRNEAVLHTDRSMLPRRRRAWASWNFHLRDEPVGLLATMRGPPDAVLPIELERCFAEEVLRRVSLGPLGLGADSIPKALGGGLGLGDDSIAKALGRQLFEWHIKSTTKAQHGLYEYDAVSRLRDSQLGDERVKDIRNYIKRGKLWDAFVADDRPVLLID